MFRTLRLAAISAVIAATAWALPGQAAPVVTSGSTYDFLIYSPDSFPVTVLQPVVFDGVAQTFNVNLGGNARVLTINESETDLGNREHLISITLTGDGDLAPGTNLFANVGTNDPFNLLKGLRVTQAVLTFSGTNFADQVYDFTSLVTAPDPWDGRLPQNGVAAGFVQLNQAWDLRTIRFDVRVSELPEPGTLGLAGLALAALALRRVRSRKAA